MPRVRRRNRRLDSRARRGGGLRGLPAIRRRAPGALDRGAQRALGPLGCALIASGFLAVLWSSACVTAPPAQLEDACTLLGDRLDWYEAARDSEQRHGVPVALQLAVIHQESRFRATARPPRGRLLWVLPGFRPSTAFGYGQVLDTTWDHYRRDSGRGGADRDDFADVADFIGWYGERGARRYGIPAADPIAFYLSYHEGHGGYSRGSHRAKTWLDRVAHKVAARSARYDHQLAACRADLDARLTSWWPF